MAFRDFAKRYRCGGGATTEPGWTPIKSQVHCAIAAARIDGLQAAGAEMAAEKAPMQTGSAQMNLSSLLARKGTVRRFLGGFAAGPESGLFRSISAARFLCLSH
ncbi:MAG: hypothetical protein WD073_10685 [Xanthobacteraceae bacterium]